MPDGILPVLNGHAQRRHRSDRPGESLGVRAACAVGLQSTSMWPVMLCVSFNGHGLRQVTGLVHVGALHIGHMIGQKLKGHGGHEGLEELGHLGHVEDVFGQASQFMVTFGGYADDLTLAGHDFLHIAGGLVVVTALGTDDHHRHILIDERDGSMLHFTRGIALGVNVADLLQFQRALQGDGVVLSPTEIEKSRAFTYLREMVSTALVSVRICSTNPGK